MNEQDIKNIIEGTYDDKMEYTLRSMIRDFYNRRMLSSILVVWGYALVFVALAVFSGIKFFDNVETRDQLMYAVIFLCSIQFICLMKIFAWQMIHRNGLKREIKRLELQIVQLTEKIKNTT